VGPGSRSRSDLWLGLLLLAVAAWLGWDLVAGLASGDPDHRSFLLVARVARWVLAVAFAWLLLTERHDLAALAVAGAAVVTVVLALTVGLLVDPEQFVAPDRPKAPDDVDEARALGLLLTGILAVAAGGVLRRWWRWRRQEAAERPMTADRPASSRATGTRNGEHDT